MTAGATQVDIRNWSFVLAKLGNRAQRTVLIREKRAVSERTSNGADDPARDVNGGVGYAFENFGLQVGNVGGSNEVNEVISVRFARLVPSASRNSAGCVTGSRSSVPKAVHHRDIVDRPVRRSRATVR